MIRDPSAHPGGSGSRLAARPGRVVTVGGGGGRQLPTAGRCDAGQWWERRLARWGGWGCCRL